MNKSFIAILAVFIAGILYLLAPILTPFLVGALLAYLVNPVVTQLMRLRLSRLIAVIIMFLFLFAVVMILTLLLIPLIQTQIDSLADFIPQVIAWLQMTVIPVLKEYFGIEQLIDVAALKVHLAENWTKAGGIASWVLTTILHSGVALLHWLLNVVLIPVVTFYLLYDWQRLVNGLHAMLPRKYAPTVTQLVAECNDVLGGFFRGQLLVMLTLGIYYSIGLSVIGLKIGLVVGMLVGLLSIVPYLGIIIGIIIASIAAFVQFGHYTAVIPVWLLFAVGQILDGMFVTPQLVGERIGLHPVAVIFAVLAGGTLFGFFGVLLALPVAAILVVVLRFVNQRYRHSQLYQ